VNKCFAVVEIEIDGKMAREYVWRKQFLQHLEWFDCEKRQFPSISSAFMLAGFSLMKTFTWRFVCVPKRVRQHYIPTFFGVVTVFAGFSVAQILAF
jgi:hypothetical protein